jgi:hypothetical protein
MKVALLCNGPSRVAFKGKEEYNYVMGCNIPWCEVDGITMIDVSVARYYATHELPSCEVFLSDICWNTLKGFRKDGVKFTDYLITKNLLRTIVDTPKEFYSTGHVAALQLIELGAGEIDIYGCDSYFEEVIDSITWQYVPSTASDKHKAKQILEWRKNWEFIKSQFNVKLNFIKS